MSGGGARVSIPAGVRRTIQNIKEIAGNHSDEEIYAMLKECGMDPNETAQKLLLQDMPKLWRPGLQGRGGRGGRGNYPRSVPSGISISGATNDPSNINLPMLSQGSNVSDVSGIAQWDKSFGAVATKTGTSRSVLKDVNHGFASGRPDSDQCSSDKTASPVLEIYASVSDPVLVPSLDTHKARELEAIKQVTGIQSSIVETATSRVAPREISGYKLSYITPVPNKEWKPKTIQANASQASEMTDTSEVSVVAEAVTQSSPAACSVTTEEPAVKLEKKVNELKLSEKQHVIIPNHLQVPESERHGLSFGSFDANFELNMVVANGPARVEIDTPFCKSPEIEETLEKPSLSYYTPFYRPTTDADGRISPFLSSSASSRYNANIAVLPAQTGQTSQENTNSAVLSTVGSTPLGTQAAGAMQGSVAIPQQPVPVFRQPAGLHLSHYPPNYIPYNQYFSPSYVPPPTLHHFLSSAAFPQQPPTGSMYQTPGAATPATAVKYSIPQYKAGANIGNSAIVGLPTVYGTYSSTPAGYTSGPAASSGNSTANEDLGSSQFKENSVYVPGQQKGLVLLCYFSESMELLVALLA
ncbi:hypothetical protein BHE74_00010124 [Ensete ventricosum]|nr:hypothetical protein BHE74_00010124 [Ensete ventricosum]